MKTEDQSMKEAIDLGNAILNEPMKVTPPKEKQKADIQSLTEEDKDRIILKAALQDRKSTYHPEEWMQNFKKYHNLKYTYKTESISTSGVPQRMKVFMAFLRQEVKKFNLNDDFSKQDLEDMVVLWMSNEDRDFLKQYKAKLDFAESDKDYIKEWVRACTGKEGLNDIAVMRHFVWQVRRKIFGMPVEHHMMPILYGRTGGGKSVAVNSLLKPLEEVSLSKDLTVFSDQFGMRQFGRCYVMFFDEMAKSDKADIDKLKNIITSPTVDYRRIFSEDMESHAQSCTFIGCSNDLVRDKIYDPTSARRYWQLDCSDKIDWTAINSIDYLALWRSVDETAPCPVIPYLAEIREIQEKKVRATDLIEDWLTSECEPKQYSPQDDPTSAELYLMFGKWCSTQSVNNQPTAQKFYRRLETVVKHLQWNVGPHRNNRGTVWSLKMGSKSDSLKVSYEVLQANADLAMAEHTNSKRIRELERKVHQAELREVQKSIKTK